MNRSKLYVFYGIVALASLGLLSQLITNTAGFLKMLLFTVVIIAIAYFVITRFVMGASNHTQQRAFRKAVQQSKKKYKDKSPQQKQNVTNLHSVKAAKKVRTRKKSDIQLTVIEGKKMSKKKKRASF